jgi:hypothetical protein
MITINMPSVIIMYWGKIRQISVSKSYEMVYRHFEKFATKRFKRVMQDRLNQYIIIQSTLIASTLPNKIMMMVKRSGMLNPCHCETCGANK